MRVGRADTPEEIQKEISCIGVKSLILNDAAAAAEISLGKHLRLWRDDKTENLWIDRFDVRNELECVELRHKGPLALNPLSAPGPCEYMLDDSEASFFEDLVVERFQDLLDFNEEDLQRDTYEEVTDDLSEDGALDSPDDVIGESSTQASVSWGYQSSRTEFWTRPEREAYLVPELWLVPSDVKLPMTKLQFDIIVHTVKNIRTKGTQFEILLKLKQSDTNPLFDFLNRECDLNRVYDFIKNVPDDNFWAGLKPSVDILPIDKPIEESAEADATSECPVEDEITELAGENCDSVPNALSLLGNIYGEESGSDSENEENENENEEVTHHLLPQEESEILNAVNVGVDGDVNGDVAIGAEGDDDDDDDDATISTVSLAEGPIVAAVRGRDEGDIHSDTERVQQDSLQSEGEGELSATKDEIESGAVVNSAIDPSVSLHTNMNMDMNIDMDMDMDMSILNPEKTIINDTALVSVVNDNGGMHEDGQVIEEGEVCDEQCIGSEETNGCADSEGSHENDNPLSVPKNTALQENGLQSLKDRECVDSDGTVDPVLEVGDPSQPQLAAEVESAANDITKIDGTEDAIVGDVECPASSLSDIVGHDTTVGVNVEVEAAADPDESRANEEHDAEFKQQNSILFQCVETSEPLDADADLEVEVEVEAESDPALDVDNTETSIDMDVEVGDVIENNGAENGGGNDDCVELRKYLKSLEAEEVTAALYDDDLLDDDVDKELFWGLPHTLKTASITKLKNIDVEKVKTFDAIAQLEAIALVQKKKAERLRRVRLLKKQFEEKAAAANLEAMRISEEKNRVDFLSAIPLRSSDEVDAEREREAEAEAEVKEVEEEVSSDDSDTSSEESKEDKERTESRNKSKRSRARSITPDRSSSSDGRVPRRKKRNRSPEGRHRRREGGGDRRRERSRSRSRSRPTRKIRNRNSGSETDISGDRERSKGRRRVPTDRSNRDRDRDRDRGRGRYRSRSRSRSRSRDRPRNNRHRDDEERGRGRDRGRDGDKDRRGEMEAKNYRHKDRDAKKRDDVSRVSADVRARTRDRVRKRSPSPKSSSPSPPVRRKVTRERAEEESTPLPSLPSLLFKDKIRVALGEQPVSQPAQSVAFRDRIQLALDALK